MTQVNKIDEYIFSKDSLKSKREFQEVYQCVHHTTYQKAIIKHILISKRKQYSREIDNIEIYNSISHPCILKLVKKVTLAKSINYFYQHYQQTLKDSILTNQKLIYENINSFVKQIFEGIQYLVIQKFVIPTICSQSIVLINQQVKFRQLKLTKKQNQNEWTKQLKNLVQNVGTILSQMIGDKKISQQLYVLKKSLNQKQKPLSFIQMLKHPFVLNKLKQVDISKKETQYQDKMDRYNSKTLIDCKQMYPHLNPQKIQQNIQPLLDNNKIVKKKIWFELNWLQVIIKIDSWVEGYIYQNQINNLNVDKCRNLRNLHSILLKQIISQFDSLKKCIKNGQNIFKITSFQQFLLDRSKLRQFQPSLKQLQNTITEANIHKKYSQVSKDIEDRRLCQIFKTNFKFTANISCFSISYALKCITNMHSTISSSLKYEQLIKTIKLVEQRNNHLQQFNQFLKFFLLLDYLTTYCVINYFLVDQEESKYQNAELQLINKQMFYYKDLSTNKIRDSGLYECSSEDLILSISDKLKELKFI